MITVEQLLEIQNLEIDNRTSVTFQIELLSICEDLDPDLVRRMPVRELRERTHKYLAYLGKEFELNQKLGTEEFGELFLKPFKELTLGEFIDLEHYMSAGDIDKMLAVLYRHGYSQAGLKNSWEEYDTVDVDTRATWFLKIDISDVMRSVVDYRNFRNEIIDTYSSLFGDDESTEDIDEDEMDSRELALRKAEQAHKQFAWEAFIMFMANDDVTKWKEICDLPLFLALNIASWRKGQLKK